MGSHKEDMIMKRTMTKKVQEIAHTEQVIHEGGKEGCIISKKFW